MVKTEDEIYQSLWDKSDYAGVVKKIDKQEYGKLDMQYSLIAAEMYEFDQRMDDYNSNNSLINATDEDAIREHARPFYFGYTKTPSQIILKISRDVNNIVSGDIFIPRGTYVETQQFNPIQYVTAEDRYLFAGQNFIRVRAFSAGLGLNTMVEAGDIQVVSGNAVKGITVTNEQASWGGHDDEDPDNIKRNALGARYEFEKVSKIALDGAMNSLGIPEYRYNLSEFAYGNGSGAVYINSEIEEEVQQIADYLRFAFGIYHKIEMATEVEVSAEFDVVIASSTDLLPNIRDSFKLDFANTYKQGVLENGVGIDLREAKIRNYLFDNLTQYEMADIKMTVSGPNKSMDENGNIYLEDYEVLKVVNVVVNIVTD